MPPISGNIMMKCIGVGLLGMTCFGMSNAIEKAVPSPSADTHLICQSDDPTDCYSRIFQPTKDFQTVREGQDLPPGLHVRMNVWTGEKEARLNIPTDDDIEVDGMPIEQSVVLVDQPKDNGVNNDEPSLRDRVPQKPPAYDPAGRIVPPQESDGFGGDSENFWNAIRIIGSNFAGNKDLDLALADLVDLAHDIYFGVELAKDGNVLQKLVSLMSCDYPNQRRQAASILGGSMQNNPSALREARKAWDSRIYPKTGQNYKEKKVCEDENLLAQVHQSLRQETDSAATRAKISAVAGLSKDPDMRDCFVVNLGMGDLLEIFLKESTEWDSTRIKVAQYVMDTFLDEDMGAQIGVWPRGPADLDNHCQEPTQAANQDCWEYHLTKKMQEQEQYGEVDEWLSDFLRLLRKSMEAFPSPKPQIKNREL